MASGRSVELLETRMLSPTVKGFVFRCADGEPLPYVPGQWLNFDVPSPSGELLRRAYSIASAPDPERPERFEIAVTRVEQGGTASIALHDLAPGARLQADGPHGFFTREEGRELPALFVGTGTGVCPLRAMLEDELRAPDGPPLALLFGCRSENDILYRDELSAWAREKPRFSLHLTLSRAGTDWSGLRGYVQQHLPQLIAPAQKPHVYVCGLTKMISDVRNTLKTQLGYDRKLIHSERYD